MSTRPDATGVPGASPPARVTGVLFDMGGTLFGYGNRKELGRAHDAALRRLGFDPDAPDVLHARRTAFEHAVRQYATRRAFLHRDLFRDGFSRTAELLGAHADSALLDQFDAENTQAFIDHLIPQDDALTTLQSLGERSIYRAVVSNADDAWVEPALRRHGLVAQLEDWTSSEEAASCKPDAVIFRYALAKAGLDPGNVLFVGDSVAHDVVGGRAAGMRTVLIGEEGAVAPLSDGLASDVVPDFRIQRLTELLAIVDTINSYP